jgi:hypothetical protein
MYEFFLNNISNFGFSLPSLKSKKTIKSYSCEQKLHVKKVVVFLQK